MHIVIDRVKTLKTLKTKLVKRRRVFERELRQHRAEAKAKALVEAAQRTLNDIHAFDPAAPGSIPEAVLARRPYDARQTPSLGLPNIEHAIAVRSVSCEATLRPNENDATAQCILRDKARSA